jgi:S-DNA-T family DNA segregation ATPase FtsK/SpoIIIE
LALRKDNMKNRYKQAVDNKKRQPRSSRLQHRLREGLFLLMVACAIFLLISLATYHANDSGWSSTGSHKQVANWGGQVGAYISGLLLELFGLVAWLFPILIILSSWPRKESQKKNDVIKKSHEWIAKSIGWVFTVSSACALVSFYFIPVSHLPAASGGIIGDLLGTGLSILFNKTGSTLLFVTTFLCGITLITGLSWLWLTEALGSRLAACWNYLLKSSRERISQFRLKIKKPETQKPQIPKRNIVREEPKLFEKAAAATPVPVPKPVIVPRVEAPREKKKIEVDPTIRMEPGSLPPNSLLNATPHSSEKASLLFFLALSLPDLNWILPLASR